LNSSSTSRRLSSSKVIQVDYEIKWTPNNRRILQTLNRDIEDDLSANFTDYVNLEESIKEIKVFINSNGVPVDEVSLTMPIGEEVYTRQPSQSPSLSIFYNNSNNYSFNERSVLSNILWANNFIFR